MVRVFIPAFRKIDRENDKSYTVFTLEVQVTGHHGHSHTVEKRYSEFEELHKKLKKVMRTPEFPPKKVLKWNHKVLEHRRQALESYIQGVLEQGNTPKYLQHFLEIRDNSLSSVGSSESLDQLNGRFNSITHQPVLAFTAEDVFLMDTNNKGGLPDIVTYGAIQGLYCSAEDLR